MAAGWNFFEREGCFSEQGFEMRAEAIQDRTQARMIRAEEAVVTLIASPQMARDAGRPAEEQQVA